MNNIINNENQSSGIRYSDNNNDDNDSCCLCCFSNNNESCCSKKKCCIITIIIAIIIIALFVIFFYFIIKEIKGDNKCSSEDEIKYEIYSSRDFYIVPQNNTCVIFGYKPNPCSNLGLYLEKVEIKCDEAIIYITDSINKKIPTNQTSTEIPICIQMIIPITIIIKFNRLPKNITVLKDGHYYPYTINN